MKNVNSHIYSVVWWEIFPGDTIAFNFIPCLLHNDFRVRIPIWWDCLPEFHIKYFEGHLKLEYHQKPPKPKYPNKFLKKLKIFLGISK